MTGFMNAELEALRNNLECGHCAAKFKGSASQARKMNLPQTRQQSRARQLSEARRPATSQRL